MARSRATAIAVESGPALLAAAHDEDAVGAAPGGQTLGLGLELSRIGRGVEPARASKVDPALVGVDAERDAARGRQQLERQLPDEPEPDDADDVTRGRPRSSRTPCSAIEAIVAYAASSGATPSGTRATRLRGTATTSACDATPAPAQATRSPGAAGAPSQLSTTIPDSE